MILKYGDECPECGFNLIVNDKYIIRCLNCGFWQNKDSLITFLIKVKDINPQIIQKLIQYGEVGIVSKILNILSVTTLYENKNIILSLDGVITAEVDSLGKFV